MLSKMKMKLKSAYVRVKQDRHLHIAMGIGAFLGFAFMPVEASAALPFENTLCMVAQSFSGPIAKSVAVIAIVVTGLMIALTEISGVFKTLLGLVFGLSFALLANQWLGLFGTTSSCVGY